MNINRFFSSSLGFVLHFLIRSTSDTLFRDDLRNMLGHRKKVVCWSDQSGEIEGEGNRKKGNLMMIMLFWFRSSIKKSWKLFPRTRKRLSVVKYSRKHFLGFRRPSSNLESSHINLSRNIYFSLITAPRSRDVLSRELSKFSLLVRKWNWATHSPSQPLASPSVAKFTQFSLVLSTKKVWKNCCSRTFLQKL